MFHIVFVFIIFKLIFYVPLNSMSRWLAAALRAAAFKGLHVHARLGKYLASFSWPKRIHLSKELIMQYTTFPRTISCCSWANREGKALTH